MWVEGKIDADEIFDELLDKHGKEVIWGLFGSKKSSPKI